MNKTAISAKYVADKLTSTLKKGKTLAEKVRNSRKVDNVISKGEKLGIDRDMVSKYLHQNMIKTAKLSDEQKAKMKSLGKTIGITAGLAPVGNATRVAIQQGGVKNAIKFLKEPGNFRKNIIAPSAALGISIGLSRAAIGKATSNDNNKILKYDVAKTLKDITKDHGKNLGLKNKYEISKSN